MNRYIATSNLMFPDTILCSICFMNHLHGHSDLRQTVLPCKVTMSHTPWLLLMGAHEGHGLQAETAGNRTLTVNHGIHWLHNEKWWSYQLERQTVPFEMYIIVCTGWWFWTVIIVCYLLSEVEVQQRIHKFQDRQGTGLSHPLHLRILPNLLSQLLCGAVAAIQTFHTLGHPWLQRAGQAVFLKQPIHPGKQAGSYQDLE